MWPRFTDSLEHLVVQKGLLYVFLRIAAVFGVVTGLGIALKPEFAAVLVLAAIILVLLVTVVAQLADRRRLYARDRDRKRVLTRYARRLIAEQNEQSFRIDEWVEEVTIRASGDARIERWFTLTVGDKPLETFWHRAYRSEASDKRTRQRVRVMPRNFLASADGGPVLGTGLEYTHQWESEDGEESLRIFIHFRHAVPAHEQVRVYLRIDWPSFYDALLDGARPVPFEWTFRRPIGELRFLGRFAADCKLDGVLAVTPHQGSGTPAQELEGDQLVVRYEEKDPDRGRLIGFVLERRLD